MKKIIFIIALLLSTTLTAQAGFLDWLGFGDNVGGGLGTLEMLNSWRATSTPVSGITPNVSGKTIYAPYSDSYFANLFVGGTATTTTLCFADNTCQTTAVGALTPWTENIDGGGFNLTNVGYIEADTGTSTISNLDVTGDLTVGANIYGSFTFVTSGDLTTTGALTVAGTTNLGTIATGLWNGTAIDFSTYTNATASTGITFTDDAISVTDNYLLNNANDTTTGTITSAGLIVGDGQTVGATTNKWLFDDTNNDVTTTGSVGIGTTSPTYIFDVYGDTRIDGNIIADVPTADNHLTTKAYVDAASGTSKTELWPDGTACTAGIENQLGWDDGASAITYCDGSNWIVEETGCGETIRHGGQSYNTIQIGTQCWFAENLNIGTKLAAGTTEPANNGTIEKWCYDNSDANCTTDGGFYNWDEAMQYTETAGAQGICPADWHIPTDSEQDTLDQYLSTGTCDTSRSDDWDCAPAGTALKELGSSGFEGVLSGYRGTSGAFDGSGAHADFWSSSVSGASAWRRYLGSSGSTVGRSPDAQADGFSVRCLKN